MSGSSVNDYHCAVDVTYDELLMRDRNSVVGQSHTWQHWRAHFAKLATPQVLRWARKYRLKTFAADCVAAAVVGAMLIPQAMVCSLCECCFVQIRFATGVLGIGRLGTGLWTVCINGRSDCIYVFVDCTTGHSRACCADVHCGTPCCTAA